MNFYEAWNFLNEHRIFKDKHGLGRFQNQCLIIDVVNVDPKNDTIEDNETLNTKTQVWLECGEYVEKYKQGCHDVDLDCGGDTFEEAVIELAKLVYEKFGE